LKKKSLVSVALLGMLTFGITSEAYAVATTGWSFYSWHNSSSGNPNYQYSSTWTTNSSNNTITISGWQDAYGSPVADLQYEVVENGTWGWYSNWVPKRFTGNYPKSGTWFSHSFSGIPNGKNVAIKQTIFNGSITDGAGNAYQTY
jgi:hypothetical protein